MSANGIQITNFNDKSVRTLHLAWFAFFLSFVAWFNHAPFSVVISEAMNLTSEQWKALLILNVALTIPARIAIGMLVDKFGPRATFSILLMTSGVLCSFFALAQTYEQLALARFLMGFTGAGFVIGIRLIGEWFPARQVGLAEGIYGGWGNFGSAAAALTLPTVAAVLFGGEDGWRYALLGTGVVAFLYGIVFYAFVRDTPEGSTYFKPKKAGALEVAGKGDFYFLLFMNLPMCVALGVLAWRLSPAAPGGIDLLSPVAVKVIWVGLVLLYAFQAWKTYQVNADVLQGKVEESRRYKFKQVAILNLNYAVTFGGELAVVSMLPFFFATTFGMDPVKAGLFGASFAVMCLVARPMGGWLSDKAGRRRIMTITLLGQALGYFAMSRITGDWPVALAVAVTSFCACFALAGCGAVFAIVPLIKRRLTGQIAGMTGAYGNVGGVTFLTVYSFVDASTFFLVVVGASVLAAVVSQFLEEPEGHTVEVMEDGTVQLIEVG